MAYDFKGAEYDILTGDCLESLKTLPEGCVNAIVTSPPYFNLREYGGGVKEIGRENTPREYICRLVSVFHEARRVLKDDGTVWVNIGDSYAKESYVGESIKQKDMIGIPWMLAFALRDDGWYLRSDIIWAKKNCMPQSVVDRCSSSHEYMFMFSKQPKYHFDYEAIEEPALYSMTDPRLGKPRMEYDGKRNTGDESSNGQKSFAVCRTRKMPKFGGNKYPCSASGADDTYSGREWTPKTVGSDDGVEVAVRRKRDVWNVATHGYEGAHFATYPEELIEPCVLAGCPVGGVVLDPFSGSGTTGCVAIRNHRKYIGLELNPEYVSLSCSRISKETSQTDFMDVLGIQK